MAPSGPATELTSLSPAASAALVLGTLLVHAFFVSAKCALSRLRPSQLEDVNDGRRKNAATEIVERYDSYATACQLGITLTSLGLGWIAATVLAPRVTPLLESAGLSGRLATTSSLIATFLAVAAVHLLLGDRVPRLVATHRPVPVGLTTAGPLMLVRRLLAPALWFFDAAGVGLLRLFGVEIDENGDTHDEEDLRRMVASDTESDLPEEKRKLLDNVFELSERVVRQVMVPRPEVVFLDIQQSLEENLDRAKSSGHTRFPLCDGDLDHVVGLIHIKDLFRAEQIPDKLEEAKRETFFVPETLPLERLMLRMRNSHLHMAAVLDEYGSVSGIVTLENVIEEIVGEIQDEFDAERPELTKIADGSYQVLGSMLLADLEDELAIEIDSRDEDTIAGIALSEIGRRPRVGDRATVGPIELEVLEVELNRILALEVTVDEEVQPPEDDSDPADLSTREAS